MANSNTVAGFTNLPAKFIGVTTAKQTFTVPAGGVAGTSIPGLPSPTQPVGSAITLCANNDVNDSRAWNLFKIKISGIALGIGGSTLTLNLNQITQANIGQIGAAKPVTAAGVDGTGLNLIASPFSTLTLGALTVQFYTEVIILWDSTVARLNGFSWSVSALSNAGLLPSPPVFAEFASGFAVTTAADLNFTLSASIDTSADGTTYVKLNEFGIERV
jgi:hypothetical protein